MTLVTELNPADVLFGRGSGPNDHEGNIRFRQRVADRKNEYLSTNHRITKAKIAREIVDSVLNEHGRFLKKAAAADAQSLGVPNGVDVWVTVDEDTVMEKAKQALRQNTNKMEQEQKDSKWLTKKTPTTVIEVTEEEDDFEPIPISSSEEGPLPAALASHLFVTRWEEESPLDTNKVSMPVHVQMSTGEEGRHQQKYTVDSSNSPDLLTTRTEMMRSKSGDSMRMDELLNSFSKLRGSQLMDESKRMMASQDTMGTIDMLPEGSVADMSMGSSTFSFFKGNDSMMTKGNDSMLSTGFESNNSQSYTNSDRYSLHSNPQAASVLSHSHSSTGTGAQASSSGTGAQSTQSSHLTSESSISLSEVWNGGSHRKSSSLTTTAEVNASVKNAMDEVRREEESARNARVGMLPEPRPQVVLMQENSELFAMSGLLGQGSSMEMLKAAAFSVSDFDLPSEPNIQTHIVNNTGASGQQRKRS